MTKRQIARIVREVEESVGCLFTSAEIVDVLAYSERKAALNKKDEEYLPLLFKNELEDLAARSFINLIGKFNIENRRLRNVC